jgi:hypothetical protein
MANAKFRNRSRPILTRGEPSRFVRQAKADRREFDLNQDAAAPGEIAL